MHMNALLCNSRLRFKHSFSTENNPSHSFPYLWFISWCCSEVQSLRGNLLLSLQNNVFCWFLDYQIKWNKNPREKPSWRRAVERKYLFPASCRQSNKFYWLTEWEMCRRKETQMISKKKRQKLEIYGWMMKRIERKWGEWNFLLGKAAPQSRRAYTSRIALLLSNLFIFHLMNVCSGINYFSHPFFFWFFKWLRKQTCRVCH